MFNNIEASKQPRTLVLCFDGTASEYEKDNTNVVKLFSLLKKDDSSQQLCYYQAGIGTFFAPGVVSPLFEWVAKIADEAVAWYLNQHVMDGYRFLMQNYRAGDRICMFGFSRGAYTARALAGMLYKVGLLPRDNQEQIPFAYKLYKQDDEAGMELSNGFKHTFCRNVQIEFMGVWDTVASVGVVMGRTLPFTTSNRAIKTFRHAISLDEHRSRFRPNLFHRASPGQDPEFTATVSHDSGAVKAPSNKLSFCRTKKIGGSTFFHPDHWRHSPVRSTSLDDEDWDPTNVLEVWFAGCHSDIGGNEPMADPPHSIGNIPLRWMIRQVISSQCGIAFDEAALSKVEIRPSLVFQPPKAHGGPGIADEVDAQQPIHDRLQDTKIWWLLEVIPLRYSWQDAQGVWHSEFRWNLGRGRTIEETQPNFHTTVKERMANESLNYRPRAIWNGNEVYVE
ncbi:hypothetical protein EDD18DRAFT_1305975 [Armillaria luteobubalina]|uniref:T6SS Phospholipase effector Tle1-like catalytic domain-containing protein n=1 Tax=Armillaria luteobubalina TaxID=153913 RepID=A0AA39QMF6_9AGAR|nr:hypothetical protein EDD18DRAFT_1305975 [Armillaria luteobubalina]